jgi:hypothetical protein
MYAMIVTLTEVMTELDRNVHLGKIVLAVR